MTACSWDGGCPSVELVFPLHTAAEPWWYFEYIKSARTGAGEQGRRGMKYTSDEIQSAGTELVTADVVAESPSLELAGSAMTYTPLQLHFLSRLERLRNAKAEIDTYTDDDPFMKRLVDRGLFATYRECIDEGVGAEARHVLHI